MMATHLSSLPLTNMAEQSPVRKHVAWMWTRAWSHPSLVRVAAGILPGTHRPPPSPGPFDACAVRRILVGRTDGIGDMVLTLPLFAEIRRNFPKASVLLLTSSKSAELLRGSPLMDEVVTIAPKGRGFLGRAMRWRSWGLACRRICRGGIPDLAIFPRWGMDLEFTSALGFLSGARWRAGYTEKTHAAKAYVQHGYDSLLTHVYEAPCDHEARLNVRILKALGIDVAMQKPSLELTGSEVGTAQRWLEEQGLAQTRSLVALGVGANEPKRRWPVEAYAEIVKRLSSERGTRFIVIGGPQESSDAQWLCEQFPGICHDATSGISLRETAALSSFCQLYIGNNSGPMHLAALMNVPVVYVSCHSQTASDEGSNSDFRFAPFGVPYTCLRPARPLDGCAGDCDVPAPHCIRQITPEEVLAASTHALQGRFEATALS